MIPLSISGPIPFGWHRDDTIAAAELRQQCVLVVGETGSGKSVVLQNINAGLVRCPDVLVWHIDLGGAGMALPWLGPWLDGEARRPVVDWVAPDVDEALAMTETALGIIQRRRVAYRRATRRADVDMLPLTHELPGIYIVLDEGAEAMGITASPKLQAQLVSIIELGRSTGVRVVMSGLRATADIVPARAKRQLGLRIGMQVTDPEELNHLFGWALRPDPEDTPYPGCGLWRDGGSGPVRPFRSWDLTRPSSVERIAVACESWRPTLDGPSLDGPWRGVYEGRWDRVRPMLDGEVPPGPVAVQPSAGAGLIDYSGVDAALARAKAALAQAGVETESVQSVRSRFREIVQHLGPLDDDPRLDGDTLPRASEPRARMLQLLDGAGEVGMSGVAVQAALAAERLPVALSTLYDWLAADAVKLRHGVFVHPRFGQR